MDGASEIGGSPNTAGRMGSNTGVAPSDVPSGGASNVVESTAEEQNIKTKAAGGIVIDNSDLHGYLGHFAKDDVMRRGHNVGHKKLGVAHKAARTTAKQGYTKLPGSASAVQGHAHGGEPDLGVRTTKQQKAAAAMDRRLRQMNNLSHETHPMILHDDSGEDSNPRGVVPKSHAVSDVKMSVRHHRESIANDKKHLADHKASINKHTRDMNAQMRRLRKK